MNPEGLAEALGQRLLARGWRLVTAESCTGGWLAAVITEIPGSSQWYERGFITYSNASKQELLGVAQQTLDAHGAVSEETALAMAQGALCRSWAQCSVAITGIAGPDGGSEDKPVGTVWLAWATLQRPADALGHRFNGDRRAVRGQAVDRALRGLLERLS
ncbi:MAG: CinA family protein [Gammaproteobacteria bacterium]